MELRSAVESTYAKLVMEAARQRSLFSSATPPMAAVAASAVGGGGVTTHFKSFKRAAAPALWAQAIGLRIEVFVHEQKIPEEARSVRCVY